MQWRLYGGSASYSVDQKAGREVISREGLSLTRVPGTGIWRKVRTGDLSDGNPCGKPWEIAFGTVERYRLGYAMRCPFCHADKDSLKVIDSRACDGDRAIRRRRECLNCKKRFTTYERVEGSVKLTVVKQDGRRTPWDRQKIVDGLERACFKRPVPEEDLLRVAEEVEEECFAKHDREVPTSAIGEMVADRLRRLDQVAYVRFASVYKQFKTLDELIEVAQSVLDAKRFEDPTQGRLFIEPPSAKPKPENGRPPPPKGRRFKTTRSRDVESSDPT